MTRLARAVAILRHNVQLDGDANLALREFEALVGAGGKVLKDRSALSQALLNAPVAAVPFLSKNSLGVAVLWCETSIDRLIALRQQSAFLQELIVQSEESELDRFVEATPYATVRLPTIGEPTVVSLAWNYIIESESVLGSETCNGRIDVTTELLMAPFLGARVSLASTSLRKAIKTTLYLSHDLHIYKAKFFPRMVRALLNLYAVQGQRILDPFCGSGTALLEASLLGLPSRGFDIDPICQMIARAKVAPFLDGSSTKIALDAFEHALRQPVVQTEFELPAELAKKIARKDAKEGTGYLLEIKEDAARLFGALKRVLDQRLAVELVSVLASDALTKKIRYRFVGVGNGRYTIEIVKQRIIERLFEKITRCRQLVEVFQDLRDKVGVRFGAVEAGAGDARDLATWPLGFKPGIVMTSPPYLPASSGREHYAASRALAFATLGYIPGMHGYHDDQPTEAGQYNKLAVSKYPESDRLMSYLASDASDIADPQRDAMRFERKADPTLQYLAHMHRFFSNIRERVESDGRLLLVVAYQHVFYSHRRQELEHIVSGQKLYAELASAAGLELEAEIEMELLKSANSRARPMAKQDYSETVLIFRRSAREDHVGSQQSAIVEV